MSDIKRTSIEQDVIKESEEADFDLHAAAAARKLFMNEDPEDWVLLNRKVKQGLKERIEASFLRAAYVNALRVRLSEYGFPKVDGLLTLGTLYCQSKEAAETAEKMILEAIEEEAVRLPDEHKINDFFKLYDIAIQRQYKIQSIDIPRKIKIMLEIYTEKMDEMGFDQIIAEAKKRTALSEDDIRAFFRKKYFWYDYSIPILRFLDAAVVRHGIDPKLSESENDQIQNHAKQRLEKALKEDIQKLQELYDYLVERKTPISDVISKEKLTATIAEKIKEASERGETIKAAEQIAVFAERIGVEIDYQNEAMISAIEEFFSRQIGKEDEIIIPFIDFIKKYGIPFDYKEKIRAHIEFIVGPNGLRTGEEMVEWVTLLKPYSNDIRDINIQRQLYIEFTRGAIECAPLIELFECDPQERELQDLAEKALALTLYDTEIGKFKKHIETMVRTGLLDHDKTRRTLSLDAQKRIKAGKIAEGFDMMEDFEIPFEKMHGVALVETPIGRKIFFADEDRYVREPFFVDMYETCMEKRKDELKDARAAFSSRENIETELAKIAAVFNNIHPKNLTRETVKKARYIMMLAHDQLMREINQLGKEMKEGKSPPEETKQLMDAKITETKNRLDLVIQKYIRELVLEDLKQGHDDGQINFINDL